jgi:hypothetical protein
VTSAMSFLASQLYEYPTEPRARCISRIAFVRKLPSGLAHTRTQKSMLMALNLDGANKRAGGSLRSFIVNLSGTQNWPSTNMTSFEGFLSHPFLLHQNSKIQRSRVPYTSCSSSFPPFPLELESLLNHRSHISFLHIRQYLQNSFSSFLLLSGYHSNSFSTGRGS